MTPSDLQRIRELASKATPGPWSARCVHGEWRVTSGPGNGIVADTGLYPTGEPDACYLAACSPDVILALLDRAERAERERDELDDGEGLLAKVRDLCKRNEAIRAANAELADIAEAHEHTLAKLGHYDGCDTDTSATERIHELRKAGSP